MLSSDEVLQGRYVIERRIGGGGMGTVYLADDSRLKGRRCAIKEMSPAELAPKDRNWSIDAFRREAEILARLNHPGLTAVTDFFAERGNWYLVMDFVEGATLETRLSNSPEGRFPIREALRVARQLLDVLEYLHDREPQVVFRDLKPGNVMVTPEGQIKLIDFGIARFFKPGKTQDTTFLGTPGYAAPEQYGGMGQSDPRTDIYSLGVLLNQMVTGHDPTAAVSPFPIPDPRSLMETMPPHVAETISRATQMRPELRYANVVEMRQDLFPPTYPLPWQEGPDAGANAPADRPAPEPTPNRRRLLSITLVGVLTLGLIGVVYGISRLLGFPPASPTPTGTSRVAGVTVSPSLDITVTPSRTPTATPTSSPSPTPTPVDTSELRVTHEAELLSTLRYRSGNGEVIFAYRPPQSLRIDGGLDEWTTEPYDVNYLVYESEDGNWQGSDDLSGAFYIAWDEDRLYVAVQVRDDVHVQTETGDKLYLGDEVEIQVDADLEGDFSEASLSDDDGQAGFSPGDLRDGGTEAYIWRPPQLEQAGTMIDVAARQAGNGYVLEVAAPWWVLGGRPAPEEPVGFCLSLSDNDGEDAAQETLVSTCPDRTWGDPTTWGTLVLTDDP